MQTHPKVFISCSSQDKYFTDWLCKKFDVDEVKYFIYTHSIPIGGSVPQDISLGLEQSNFFLVVLSPTSIISDWVKKEISLATMLEISRKEIIIVPVLLDLHPKDMPTLLLDKNAIRFQSANYKNQEREYKEIREILLDKTKTNILQQYQNSLLANFVLIDKIISNNHPTAIEARNILELFQKDEAYQRYFLSKAENVLWFDLLSAEGAFLTDNIPSPQQNEKGDSYTITQWVVLPYLEKISQELNNLSNSEKDEYENKLLEIIIHTSDKRKQELRSDANSLILDNYRVWYSFAKILTYLPKEKISINIINFFDVWMNSKFDTSLTTSEILRGILPKFLNDIPIMDDIRKAKLILRILLKTVRVKNKKKFSNRRKEFKFRIDSYHLVNLLKTYLGQESNISDKFGKIHSKSFIYFLAKEIGKVIGKNKNDHSYIWYESLYENKTISDYDHPEIGLVQIFRNILNAKASGNIDETRKIFAKLINKNPSFPIFIRFALYCYGKNYREYRADFWELVEKSEKSIFEYPSFEAETYLLLKNNLDIFSADEIEKLKELIAKGPTKYKGDNEIKNILWRQKWYSALTANVEFANLYKECRQKTNTEEFVNFRDSKIHGGWISHSFPKEDILNMSNEELTEFIPEFEAQNRNPWDEITPEGLANTIRQIATENPEKFTRDIGAFTKFGYLYMSAMIQGFADYIEKGGNNFEWDNTLNFIQEYIKQDDFWNGLLKSNGSSEYMPVIGSIANLIQSGTQKDKPNSLPRELEKEIENIFNICLDKNLSESPVLLGKTDYIFEMLNENTGKLVTALLYFSLRVARLSNTENDASINWKSELTIIYEKFLLRKIIAAYTILGYNFSNFIYLDNKWTKSKIESFIELPENLWEAFITGFLHTRKVYDDYYEMMCQHYNKAISHDFAMDDSDELLAQHIAILYLRGLDQLEDGLISKLIESKKHIAIKSLIGFIWMQRDDRSVKMVRTQGEETSKFEHNINQKVVNFWKRIANQYSEKKNLTIREKEILSNLLKLLIFVPQIDTDIVKLINISIPYLEIHRDTSFTIEYLNALKDIGNKENNAKHISEIFSNMIKNGIFPYYDEKHIEGLINFMYQHGQRVNADSICDSYAKKRQELTFIKKIWENNR